MNHIVRFARPAVAAALLLTAANAQAAEYSVLVFETPAALAARDSASAGPAYWTAFDAYARSLAGAGLLRGGSGLMPAVKAEGLTLGGYFVIDAPSVEAAQAWAAKCPAVTQGGRCEARAHLKRGM